jgi:hypothetical protein
MSKCVRCGFDNLPDAYVCVHCYAVLRGTPTMNENTTLPTREPALQYTGRTNTGQLTLDLNTLDKRTLVLYIGQMAKPIVMRVIQLAFLGRASENIKVHPLLDLTPFHAAEFGVSRIHVAIYRTVNGMAIEDRVSSNGTWLNGVRLVPRKIYKLSSGDQLFLGRLPVKAYIDRVAHHDALGTSTHSCHLKH